MSLPLIRSPESAQDVEDSVAYLLEQNAPLAALRFAKSLDEMLELLVRFPGLGSPYESTHPKLRDVRFLTIRNFKNYQLFYRVTEADLLVLRVIQGQRDLEKTLQRS